MHSYAGKIIEHDVFIYNYINVQLIIHLEKK